MPRVLPLSYTTISLMMMTLPDLGSVTTLTSAQVAHYGGMAQAYINAKIARRYSLPLSGDVDKLQEVATDLGIYYCLTRRLFTAERLNASPWPDRYREALTQLDQIADGTLPLVDSSGAVIAGRTDIDQVYSNTMDYEPTFHEGPWTLTVQDPDKIEDLLDARDLDVVSDRVVD